LHFLEGGKSEERYNCGCTFREGVKVRRGITAVAVLEREEKREEEV